MAEALVELGIAFTALAVAGALAARVDQSVIPAYILTGIVVGPNEPRSLGPLDLTLVSHSQVLDVGADLGVVFLLFFLGLEFSPDRLLARPTRLLGVGAADFAINFGVGAALAALFGFPLLTALFFASVVYISSSAVVTKSLVERGWIADPESDVILGTLVFEDLLIAVVLAVLSAVALGGGGVAAVLSSVATAAAFLLALAVTAVYGTPYVERLLSVEADELFLLFAVGITTLVAGEALAIGVSEAVAAFFVGIAFGRTNHAERLEDVVGPTRDLFAAVFFLTIGLTTDVTTFLDVGLLLAVAVVATGVSKLASGLLGGRFYGLNRRRSLRVGVGLVPRGEFSLVISSLAAAGGATVPRTDELTSFTVAYVLVMSILGTVAMQYADSLTAFRGGE
ncbi:cation:proton antiporter [Halorussus sp. MSC15.2]|uniref:cation:proton antiporter n=1 Tax=Halorussus sp. MSC15.2 TaxID=2283638 RepID=UPI0013D1BB8B|nr:cation:proton antiporter [Halorussus sp. MSC15.2]NEU58020.1 cation:proton antiporter [Halorussus sp. MSC15.2]